MAWESEGMKLEAEALEKGIRAVFDDPNRGTYLVAEDPQGRILGCLLRQREWSDWRNRWVHWIHSLYVTPPHRKKGITRRFYDYLQAQVKNDPDLGGLRLYVDHSNENAMRVYEKLGMSRDHYALYEWMK